MISQNNEHCLKYTFFVHVVFLGMGILLYGYNFNFVNTANTSII